MPKKKEKPKYQEVDDTKTSNKRYVGRYEKIWWQLLRSVGITPSEISKTTPFCERTIRNNTTGETFPSINYDFAVIATKALWVKTMMDAWENTDPAMMREYGLTAKNYSNILSDLETWRETVLTRDEMITLEKIMIEEKGLTQKTLEILQARFDKLKEKK